MIRIDSRGKSCPQPIIDIASALKEFAEENRFSLLSDDEATWIDLQAWSRMTGHKAEITGDDSFIITR